MEEQISEKYQSEFNSGIAKLMRIDKIKQGLIIATINNDYGLQFRCLKAYYKELISVMKDEDDNKQRDKFKDVRKNYNEYRKALTNGKKSIPMNIIDAFEDWEVELRNLDQKYGMDMPKKADPRFLMAGKARYRR